MESLPRKVLCDLLRDYGRDLMSDSRLKGLLMDYCGSCRAEVHLLVQAQQAGIPERLWKDSQRLPVGVVVAQLSAHLQTDYFVAEAAARWAVETWALALGLELPTPAPPAAPLPPVTGAPAPPVSRAPDFPFEPEVILIPAGEFLMGSDPQKDKVVLNWEQPQHTLYLPEYWIAKTPITNAQYAAFVQATGHKAPRHWQKGKIPQGKGAHPVVEITWHDALAYCTWLAKATGKSYTLPSEAEWEKAARGTDGRVYPWGDTFDGSKCNSWESDIKDTTPVDKYPQGASPYGVLDMAGNVWEWMRSLWGNDFREPDFKYPYQAADGRENLQAGDAIFRVLRGGSFNRDRYLARCAFRSRNSPHKGNANRGFRVVVFPPRT